MSDTEIQHPSVNRTFGAKSIIAGVGGVLVLYLIVSSYLGSLKANERMLATLEQQGQRFEAQTKIIEAQSKAIEKLNERIEQREAETNRQLDGLSNQQARIPQMQTADVIKQLAEVLRVRENPTNTSEAIVDPKELFKYKLECDKCAVELNARRQDVADLKKAQAANEVTIAAQQEQIAARTKERDEAVKAAKGGSRWQRFRRGAKNILIGIGIGAAAVAATK